MHSLHYSSKHVGKSKREGIKRLCEVDDNNTALNAHAEKESIAQKLIECNEVHFAKTHDVIASGDRMCKKLRDDWVRDRILSGKLNGEECNDKRMHQFL